MGQTESHEQDGGDFKSLEAKHNIARFEQDKKNEFIQYLRNEKLDHVNSLQTNNERKDYEKTSAQTKTFVRDSLFVLQTSLTAKDHLRSKVIMRDNKLEKENLFTLKEIDSLHEKKKENWNQTFVKKNLHQPNNKQLIINRGDVEPNFDDFLDSEPLNSEKLTENQQKLHLKNADFGEQRFQEINFNTIQQEKKKNENFSNFYSNKANYGFNLENKQNNEILNGIKKSSTIETKTIDLNNFQFEKNSLEKKLDENFYSFKFESKEKVKIYEDKEKKLNVNTIKNEDIKSLNFNLNFDSQISDLQRKFAEPSIHEKPKEIDLDFEQKNYNLPRIFNEGKSGSKQYAQLCTDKEKLIITNFEAPHEYNYDEENKDKNFEKSINKIENSYLNEKYEFKNPKNLRSDQNENFDKKDIANISQISRKDFFPKENSYRSEEDEDFAESNDHYENKADYRNPPSSVKNLKEQKNTNHQNFMSQKDLLPKRNYNYKEDNEVDLHQEKKEKRRNKKKHQKNDRSKHSKKRHDSSSASSSSYSSYSSSSYKIPKNHSLNNLTAYPSHLASPMYSAANPWYPPPASGYLQPAFVPPPPPPNPYFMMNPVNVNYGGWVSPYKMGFNYNDMINLPPNMSSMGSMSSGGFLGSQTPIIINNNMTSPNQKLEELKKRENHLFREEKVKLEERLNFQKEEKDRQQYREEFIKDKNSLASMEKPENQSTKTIARSNNQESQKNNEKKLAEFKEKEEKNVSLNAKPALDSINNITTKKSDELPEKKPMIYFQDEPSSKTLAASFLEKKKKLAERGQPIFSNNKNTDDKLQLKPSIDDAKISKEQLEKKPMTFFEDETCSKSLAELFLEKKKKLAEKMQKNSEKNKERELSVEPVNKRSKEDILKTRKEIMMEYKKTAKKSEIPKEISLSNFNLKLKEDDNKKITNTNDELLRRLALGIKPKITKKEMYALTNKNYMKLEENKAKREEQVKSEKRREELKQRKDKMKELDEKLRKNILRK